MGTHFFTDSLSTRIVVFFAVLLVLVQGLAFGLVKTANSQIAKETIGQELAVGERIFRRLLEQNREQLAQNAMSLAANSAFRQAVGARDSGTLRSVLANHGARAGVGFILLVSPDRMVQVDTLHPKATPGTFAFPHLLEAATSSETASGIAVMDGKLYQLVVVPVWAPALIGYVAMGADIDNTNASELKKLTALDVSFLSRSGVQPWKVHASTLPGGDHTSLVPAISEGDFGKASVEMEMSNDMFEARLTRLEKQGDTQVVAVLQRSLTESIKPFQRVGSAFLSLTLISLVLSIIGAVIIARRITMPINDLVDVARRIEKGDYAHKAATTEKGEIGALASSFNHMLDGIAEREKENLRLAYEDSLTGLPNRAMFYDRIQQALMLARRNGHGMSVMMLDLDRFKYVNDTLGHPVGDKVLQEVAVRLRALLRESDTVARLGGDEFAILLPNGDSERAGLVASRILQTLERPIVVDEQPIDVGTSIGIVFFPQHGEDANMLLRHADIAMYAAKRNKSGYASYDRRLEEHREEHLTLLGELRRALDRHELVLFYQPKLDLAAQQVTGVEALIRWEHPVRGNVPPSEFIPFAEQTGNIRMITRWVIESAVQQCGNWQSGGRPLEISINISARDLLDRELATVVAAAIRKHGVAPALLCFELTESALMEDPNRARETLCQLHELGVKLSVDDYGTGYSSLAYIKNLPLDELKIDREFVSGMDSDTQSAAIIRSTIELGHSLGMTVVAEGVETEMELRALTALGCDFAQGYKICRPMRAADLMKWWLAQPVVAPRSLAAANDT